MCVDAARAAAQAARAVAAATRPCTCVETVRRDDRRMQGRFEPLQLTTATHVCMNVQRAALGTHMHACIKVFYLCKYVIYYRLYM